MMPFIHTIPWILATGPAVTLAERQDFELATVLSDTINGFTGDAVANAMDMIFVPILPKMGSEAQIIQCRLPMPETAGALRPDLLPVDAIDTRRPSLGHAMDVAGDWLVVSAPFAVHHGLECGEVIIFLRHGDGGASRWEQFAVLAPEWPGRRDRFGTAVAVDFPYLAVGAAREGAADPLNLGGYVAVYRFEGEGKTGEWRLEETLRSRNPSNANWFGRTVALHGRMLAVGAPGEEVQGNASAGRLYLFERDGTSPSWELMADCFRETSRPHELFGWSTAIDGELVVVGCMDACAQADVAPPRRSGSVSCYRWNDDGLHLFQTITDPFCGGDSGFGSALLLNSNWLIVSAPNALVPGEDSMGRVVVFDRKRDDCASVFTQRQVLKGVVGAGCALFGAAMSHNDGRLCVSEACVLEQLPPSNRLYVFDAR